jgi:hypothetical protein
MDLTLVIAKAEWNLFFAAGGGLEWADEVSSEISEGVVMVKTVRVSSGCDESRVRFGSER